MVVSVFYPVSLSSRFQKLKEKLRFSGKSYTNWKDRLSSFKKLKDRGSTAKTAFIEDYAELGMDKLCIRKDSYFYKAQQSL